MCAHFWKKLGFSDGNFIGLKVVKTGSSVIEAFDKLGARTKRWETGDVDNE